MRIAALLLLFIPTFLQAQKLPVKADTLPPPDPFEGTIGYRITYSGGNTPAISTLLPDSLTLHISYPWMRATWHRGITDTLLSDVVWYAGSNQYHLIDHDHRVIYKAAELDSSLPKLTPTQETAKVAGLLCKKFTQKSGDYQDTWYLNTTVFLRRDSTDTLLVARPPFLAAGRSEIPLKFIRKSSQGTVTTTAITLSRSHLSPENFTFPAGYELLEFDRLRHRHPALGNSK